MQCNSVKVSIKMKTYCSRQVGLQYVLHGFTLSLKYPVIYSLIAVQ